MPELCIRFFGKRCEPTGMRHECKKLAGHKGDHECRWCGLLEARHLYEGMRL